MLDIFFVGTSAACPSVKRNLSCIAIKNKGKLFLFDCGEGTQRELMKLKIGFGSIEAIFISHLHLDHFLGVFGLSQTLKMNKRKTPLKIFAPIGFKKMANEILKKNIDVLEIIEIEEAEKLNFKIDDLTFTCFDTKHNMKNSFGFIMKKDDRVRFFEKKAKEMGIKGKMFSEIEKNKEIVINNKKIKLTEVSRKIKGEKISYTSDTLFFKEIIKHIEKSDLLIHEATFLNDLIEEAKERGHSTVEEAANVALLSKSKKLILTHISPRYKEDKEIIKHAKKIFENSILAYDGLKISIKND